MKRALLLITPELLVEMFKGSWPRTFEVTDFALPEDARFVDVTYINSERSIALELESESFNEVPEKAKTPPVMPSPVCRVVDESPLVEALRQLKLGDCWCDWCEVVIGNQMYGATHSQACIAARQALEHFERCHRAPEPAETES